MQKACPEYSSVRFIDFNTSEQIDRLRAIIIATKKKKKQELARKSFCLGAERTKNLNKRV